MIGRVELNDRIVMKKPHACGANEWIVTRVGADIKLRCTGCEHLIMLDRVEFLKRAKKNLSEVAKVDGGKADGQA